MTSSSPPRRVCVAVLGDEKIGKTALIRTFLEGKFPEGEVKPFSKFMQEKSDFVVDGTPYVVELSDGSVSMLVDSHVAKRMDCLLLCYNAIVLKSLQTLNATLMEPLKEYLEEGIPILIVGLQKDMKSTVKAPSGLDQQSSEDYVTIASSKELAFEWKANASIEVSSKTGEQVEFLFQTAVRLAVGERKKRTYGKKCAIM